jgi:diguanylate cyclase (GGDEF)-like protein
MNRILIADDDRISRAVLTDVLKRFGYEVLETDDGAKAWAILRGPDAPRFVILDWLMPEMDGVDVCRLIRENIKADPPYVILLTAKDDEKSLVEGLDAGANDYLTKPFRIEELRARVGAGQRMLDIQHELNRAMEALAHEATHDPLTGVRNRRAILEELGREISRARRQNSTFSIGLCDIDHFKMVNDRFGHRVGDEVLKAFTGVMTKNLREYDLLGRYGGEEFLVIAPDSRGLPEEQIYERLRKAVEDAVIKTHKGDVTITVSIGVAASSRIVDPDTLLASADTALYQAKQDGRNRVAYAVPGAGRY